MRTNGNGVRDLAEIRGINRINDYAFKRIFGSEEGKEALLSFLNAVLKLPPGRELTDVELLDREIDPKYLLDRGARLDVLARTKEGTLINIEVQVANQYNIDKRTMYYWAGLYHGQLTSGQKFADLRKTVTINILAFDWFRGDGRYHRAFHVRDDETGELLCDDLEIHFLELEKIKAIKRRPKDALEAWMMYLNNLEGEEMEAIAMENPGIRKALTIEKAFWQSKKERRLYELREKAMRDEISALAGARAEGETKGRQEAICKYLDARFGEASRDLQERIRQIDNLEALDKIINRIYTAGSLEEVKAVIDGATN
ncbi:Rpn family recombination-promoting nuclease/putative transposase [Neomoorella mulderi]|nr:Rpn family recombination-promoting nuclease/putative transposase [Moorella mulderi]